MHVKYGILFNPRRFNSIELWRDITEAQWNDPAWQIRNLIRNVSQLKHVIAFNPVQMGKIYMKNLQGWISGVTLPRHAANIEGGGGKVLLMPSGHDTLNIGSDIDEKISESFASVFTWDGRE